MTDERLKKTLDPARTERAMEDRAITESREMTEDDRIEMFRQRLFQAALPDLPKIPGFHVAWLSTTHQSDTIPARQRIGYEPIKPEDVPGWGFENQKSADFPGWISCNEMVAAKISIRLYEAYMRIAHHDGPLEEEGKLKQNAQTLKNEMRDRKSDVEIPEGLEALGQSAVRAKPVWAN